MKHLKVRDFLDEYVQIEFRFVDVIVLKHSSTIRDDLSQTNISINLIEHL